MTYAADATGPFYHGTRAALKPGDLLAPGYSAKCGRRKRASWVYLTGTLDAAIWGTELAVGDGPGRIYVVESLCESLIHACGDQARRGGRGRSQLTDGARQVRVG